MKYFIDADFILYKSAAACETEIDFTEDIIVVSSRFSQLQRILDQELAKIAQTFNTTEDDLILCFSSPSNFRKEIDPNYKGQRIRKKPCGYVRALNWLRATRNVEQRPYLEGDDVIGILATTPGNEECVIVSPDKDMLQIPGVIWDFKDYREVEPEQGRIWHLIQALAGDQTDGYSGCPGIGVKKAEALFRKKGPTWDTVVSTYIEAGLTEDDALRNARLAKILTHDLYNESTGQYTLWSP